MKTYSSPRREATVENWAHGRRRVTARFYIETGKRGERVCRVTTGKPKKSTYSEQCAIVDGDDGRTYTLHYGRLYGFVGVMRGNMKHQEETRNPRDPGYQELRDLLDRAKLGAVSFKAAYVGDVVLTGPEHAQMSDAKLIAEAIAEAKRGNVWGGATGIAESDIEIGDWTP